MTDQVFQSSYIEPLLDKDGFQREVALERAVAFHKHVGTDDPETVVETAESFRAFLAGETTSGYQPKHAAGA